MRQNAALAKWRRGEPTIGAWLSLANTHIAELVTNAGFDWVVVDLQHGLIDYADLVRMLPAISTADTTPIVRVTFNDPPQIMKVLDAGAMGVIVPMVNNRAEAEAAVACCKYPPEGWRSFGPTRAALYGGRNYATEANGEVACIAMIETPDGMKNLDEIVSTPGLGGVYVGPSDLALSLGLQARDHDDPRHVEAVAAILAACKRHGTPAGIHCAGVGWATRRLAEGFDFVTLHSDIGFMMQSVTADLAAARASLAETTPAA